MSAAVKAVKTNKEMNANVILGAVSKSKPITVKTYYLTKSSQESLRKIISLVLQKYERSDSMDTCYNSVRGLVVNATKANIKRILFKKLGFDITNPKEYLLGMEKIEKLLHESTFYKYKDELMKQDLTVKTTFTFNPEMFSITVKNNFVLLPHEYLINQKPETTNFSYLSYDHAVKSKEFSDSATFNTRKVVSLNQYKMEQQIFSQISNEETNETIVKLDIVLEDKNSFNDEKFGNQMNTIYSNYKSKFEAAFSEEAEENSISLPNSVQGSLRERGEFFNLYNRIQNLDSQLYREQQLLLANYGENVFRTIQDKLAKAKTESNEFINQIQAVGKNTFELNKKQIQEFVKERDLEIEKQIDSEIEKHKEKLESFNNNLDKRIENQSLILKAQASQCLEKINTDGINLIESTKQEMEKVTDDFKTDIESEIHIAELLKNKILEEISSEKDVLAKSLQAVQSEIRKVEKFHANKEIVDGLVKESNEAFWKMSSNIEIIKAKEENIKSFMNNINLLEAAIRDTDKELKNLDAEKSEYLAEKGKVVQTIDARVKQMEKIGEEIKQKLVEISGFERKLNVISGSLTEQAKKTKAVDDQLVKFSKEVSSLESKRSEFSQFVSEVDQKVALINSKTADIKLMESKFNHIESMMIDLSARHKQISTMEERLSTMKGNIEKLLIDADEKISKINSAVVVPVKSPRSIKSRPKKSPPNLGGVVKEIRDNVIALRKKKLSIPEIARALEVNEEMVSLILSMQ
ncbi:MAG: hypothetical protein IPL26_29205 [Leptospiraceae bacterium]|nr:hypothetical protein [Leptospiraceae bacterium]